MSVNHVKLSTGETLIDLRSDTVVPETLAEGVTAHNSQGEQITGTMTGGGGEIGSQYINTSEMTDFSYFFAWTARKEYTLTVDTRKATTFKNIFLNVNFLYDYPQPNHLFFPCTVLPSGNVENFQGMFESSALLKTVASFDTSNGTEFYNMFANCKKLQSVGLLDTSKGTDFSYMFQYCEALTTIPQLDTSKGTNFAYMFANCTALTTVPQLDTSNGTNVNGIFTDCKSLTSIPQLDTSNNKNFGYMFRNCESLTTIPQLDTSKGTSFMYMCDGCKALTTISITTMSTDMNIYTFRNCSALTDITIGEGWAVTIILNASNNISQASLHGMIENLADLTGKTAKKFTVGTTNIAKIDAEHIAMLEAKNWTYS